MKTLSLFIRCWLLIVLLALFGATAPSPAAFGCNIAPVSSFATFTYDGHNQITIGYDDNVEPFFVYDSAFVRVGTRMTSELNFTRQPLHAGCQMRLAAREIHAST